MHLLSCQGFWEWWVNLLVKHEYTLLEKSGFHSPVQYVKMMEDKALPVITTRSYYNLINKRKNTKNSVIKSSAPSKTSLLLI